MIGAILAQVALTEQVKADTAFHYSGYDVVTSKTVGDFTSTVTFKAANGPIDDGAGVVIFNVYSTNSDKVGNSYIHFENEPFTLQVVLNANDDVPGFKTVKFNGTFTGDISHDIVKKFSYSFDPSELEKSVDIGPGKTQGHITVTINGMTSPGAESSQFPSSITALVSISPFQGDGGGGGDVEGTPEPSTFVLAGLGLSGMGFYGWRRRKLCLA